MDYFTQIVSNLTIEDLTVLGMLHDHHTDSLYKSITRSEIQSQTNLTVFKLNRTLTRLSAMEFVAVSESQRTKTYYITSYGQAALQQSLKGEINSD